MWAAAASNKFKNVSFFSAGRNDASKEFRANSRKCSSVKPNRLLRQLVLPRQGRTKHRGIVSVERNHDALIEILAHRMIVQRRASSRLQIAGEANLDRNLPRSQLLHQFRILRRCQPVSDPLRAQIERAPDRFRPGIFSGVGGKPHTMVGGDTHRPRGTALAAPSVRRRRCQCQPQRRSRWRAAVPKTSRAAPGPNWRTASNIHSRETPKSRSPLRRPRSRPSKMASKSCLRHRQTPTDTYTSA